MHFLRIRGIFVTRISQKISEFRLGVLTTGTYRQEGLWPTRTAVSG
jgi:hypothetical protein